jgi:arylsulfatase
MKTRNNTDMGRLAKTTICLLLSLPTASLSLVAQQAPRPNIIVIMVDDMGFSDLGCFGSEIETPNLDGLAAKGLRFTQFYNAGVCSPSRASLLTGLYAHQVGVPRVGRTLRRDRCVTLAEALGPAGYRTIHTGKWHIGSAKPVWPLARGFDRCYSCPQGGGFYFRPSSFKSPREVVRDNDVLYDKKTDPPEGWYATDAWTEEGLKFVRESVDMKKPFLWYLAPNAPHWPLQAKPEDIHKYREVYRKGWEAIREQRYRKMVKLGIIDEKWELSPREGLPAWRTVENPDKAALSMAIYAGIVDNLDQNIGKIVAALKEWRIYDNTLILFLSDNGGDCGGGNLGIYTGKGEPGTAESFVKYAKSWANVSDTPFRKYKAWVHEGGAATPCIAHWPKGIPAPMQGGLVSEPAHLIDIMATCVDLAGTDYPKTHKGSKIFPMEGKSLLPLLEGKKFERGEPLFFEQSGNRAIRHGKWKLVSERGKRWELYDMQADRTELNNLAEALPEKVRELSALYEAWADRCFVGKKIR